VSMPQGSIAGGSQGSGSTAMPRVMVHFDRPGRDYAPRQQLAVRHDIEGLGGEPLRAVERSVLWYTEGKGEEDLGVHWFERIDETEGLLAVSPWGEFTIRLPMSPLSYEGLIVKVRWCVRVRIFFADNRDFVSEHVFDVGGISPARAPLERLE